MIHHLCATRVRYIPFVLKRRLNGDPLEVSNHTCWLHVVWLSCMLHVRCCYMLLLYFILRKSHNVYHRTYVWPTFKGHFVLIRFLKGITICIYSVFEFRFSYVIADYCVTFFVSAPVLRDSGQKYWYTDPSTVQQGCGAIRMVSVNAFLRRGFSNRTNVEVEHCVSRGAGAFITLRVAECNSSLTRGRAEEHVQWPKIFYRRYDFWFSYHHSPPSGRYPSCCRLHPLQNHFERNLNNLITRKELCETFPCTF